MKDKDFDPKKMAKSAENFAAEIQKAAEYLQKHFQKVSKKELKEFNIKEGEIKERVESLNRDLKNLRDKINNI